MEKIFYVYQLRLEGSIAPFYIGKGTGRRAQFHLTPGHIKKEKSYKNNIIKKAQREGVGILVEIIADGLSEDIALDLEVELIQIYGRRNIGTGCLANLTDGGDGVSGYVMSKEHRQLLSNLAKGRKWTEEQRERTIKARIGMKRSEATKAKMSKSASGRIASDETRAKLSEIAKNRPRRSHSEETKAKMRAAALGRKHTEETKQKLRTHNLGTRLSEETRAKMSESHRKRLCKC